MTLIRNGCILLGLLWVSDVSAASENRAYIKVPVAGVFESPAQKGAESHSKPIDQLARGQAVRTLETVGQWQKVSIFDRPLGFVESKVLSKTSVKFSVGATNRSELIERFLRFNERSDRLTPYRFARDRQTKQLIGAWYEGPELKHLEVFKSKLPKVASSAFTQSDKHEFVLIPVVRGLKADMLNSFYRNLSELHRAYGPGVGFRAEPSAPTPRCAGEKINGEYIYEGGQCLGFEVTGSPLNVEVLHADASSESVTVKEMVLDNTSCGYTIDALVLSKATRLKPGELGFIFLKKAGASHLAPKLTAVSKSTFKIKAVQPEHPYSQFSIDLNADGISDLWYFVGLKTSILGGKAPHRGFFEAINLSGRWHWNTIQEPATWDDGC